MVYDSFVGMGKPVQEIAMVMAVYRGSTGDNQSWAKMGEHPWACREAQCCYCPASVGERTESVRFWLELGAVKPTGVFLCFHQSKEMRNCVLLFYLFLCFLSLPTHPSR